MRRDLPPAKVGTVHARPYRQARPQARRHNRPNALAFGLAHRRNADFPLRHADSVKATRDVGLFVETEGNTCRLLAVAQGGVVDDDIGGGWMAHGTQQAISVPTIDSLQIRVLPFRVRELSGLRRDGALAPGKPCRTARVFADPSTAGFSPGRQISRGADTPVERALAVHLATPFSGRRPPAARRHPSDRDLKLNRPALPP